MGVMIRTSKVIKGKKVNFFKIWTWGRGLHIETGYLWKYFKEVFVFRIDNTNTWNEKNIV